MLKTLLSGLALLGMSAPVLAQYAEQVRATFERYCTSCHRIEAIGKGPMSAALALRPADLTRLSADNGGIFPLFRVVKRIDGRDRLVSDGRPMSVYSDFSEDRDATLTTDSGQLNITSQPVVDLVAYL